MTGRIQLQLAHAPVICGQLPGLETNLARREMSNVSGGWGSFDRSRYIRAIAKIIVEAVVDYFDD